MNFAKRFFRHVWMTPFFARRAFSTATLAAIEHAVMASEKKHRGQIRFVVEAELTTGQLWAGISSRQRAVSVFSELAVWDTEENNGVLVYVLLADRKVEIVADRGIHQHVGGERWRAICNELEVHFRNGDFATGSIGAIEKITSEISHYFPLVRDDPLRNEQPDKPILL